MAKASAMSHFKFVTGKPCKVTPGSELHRIIEKLIQDGCKFSATERYRKGTFTLWDAGEGRIEVHVHAPRAARDLASVDDRVPRAQHRKRIAAKVALLEELELDPGLSEYQQEWLDEHREWLKKNPARRRAR